MKAKFLNGSGCVLESFSFSQEEIEDARGRIAINWARMLGPGDRIVISDDSDE